MISASWQIFYNYLTDIARQAKVPHGDFSDLSFRFKTHEGKIVAVEVEGVGKIKPEYIEED